MFKSVLALLFELAIFLRAEFKIQKKLPIIHYVFRISLNLHYVTKLYFIPALYIVEFLHEVKLLVSCYSSKWLHCAYEVHYFCFCCYKFCGLKIAKLKTDEVKFLFNEVAISHNLVRFACGGRTHLTALIIGISIKYIFQSHVNKCKTCEYWMNSDK